MLSFSVKCVLLGWVVLGGVGCGGAKDPSSLSPDGAKPTAGPADSSSGLTTPPRGATKADPRPNACEAAGGKCLSPAAAVVCKSQPSAGCDVGMICCVM